MTLAFHLITSTIVLAILMLAARVLPLTARSRHALLLAGLAKFALPVAAITTPLRMLGVRFDSAAATASATRILGAMTPAAVAPATGGERWTTIVLVGWAVVAGLLFMLWSIRRHRLIAGALRVAAPPSHRELDALDEARREVGVRATVDLVRSAIAEAPAVLRSVRPVIVLPLRGCDDLTDDELRALLAHECAHIARRDNFIGRIEALAVAALWFHPLVWLAHHQLARTREEACDEVAAEIGGGASTYVSALVKTCRAAIAPRVAGVSCMANATLKERMKRVMNLETLKRRALSHRLAVSLAAVIVVAFTAAAAPFESSTSANDGRFQVTMHGRQLAKDQYEVSFSVVERASGKEVMAPTFTFLRGDWGQARSGWQSGDQTVDLFAQARVAKSGELEGKFEARQDRKLLQRSLLTERLTPRDSALSPSGPFNGAPISITLKDADLRDVLGVLAKLTGKHFDIDDDVRGGVTIDVTDMPWDEALDLIGRQTGTVYRVDGQTIHVSMR